MSIHIIIIIIVVPLRVRILRHGMQKCTYQLGECVGPSTIAGEKRIVLIFVRERCAAHEEHVLEKMAATLAQEDVKCCACCACTPHLQAIWVTKAAHANSHCCCCSSGAVGAIFTMVMVVMVQVMVRFLLLLANHTL